MDELLNEMAQLRKDRERISAELMKNTIRMRLATVKAIELGMYAPTIAYHLGVTKRTVYKWSK